MKHISKICFFLSLPVLFSCGKENKSVKDANVFPELYEQESQGAYKAILRPMNNHLSGFLPSGTAEIEIKEDTVKVKTLLDDDARVVHLQSVLRGTRCPAENDDTNKDGVIDMSEAYAASGSVLIPLDGDLNSSDLGANVYPSGSGFTYNRMASLSNLEADVMIRTGENLNLGGRVVLIHGVSPQTNLPRTVSSGPQTTPQASVPIACGILKRR